MRTAKTMTPAVAIGSLSGITGFPNNASYAASKSALYAFWISSSEEYSDTSLDFSIMIPDYLTPRCQRIMVACSSTTTECMVIRYLFALKSTDWKTRGIENRLALIMSRLAPNLYKAFSYLSKACEGKKRHEAEGNHNGL